MHMPMQKGEGNIKWLFFCKNCIHFNHFAALIGTNWTGILGLNSYYFDVSQKKPKRMNIFQAVIRPFQTQTSVSSSTNQRSAEEVEREEDGFMIVAETESERTTVYASDYRGDLPPIYNQVQVKDSERDW